MPRSYPTLDQRRSNAVFQDSRGFAPVGAKTTTGGSNHRYVIAAKELWKLSDDWEVNLLMTVFGPELVGSVAAALDPARRFRAGGEKVDVVRRRRVKDTQVYESGAISQTTSRTYCNFRRLPGVERDYEIVPEFLKDEFTEDTSIRNSPDQSTFTTFFEDSTDSLRADGCIYNEQESCKVSDLKWNIPNTEPKTCIKIETYQLDDIIPGGYERTESSTVFHFLPGPVVPIVDNFGNNAGLQALHESAKQLATDKLDDLLPKCLSNRRLFSAAYELGELKDLKKLFAQQAKFVKYLRTLAKDPKTALMKIDKLTGDAYLAYLFGQQSLQKSIESLLKLPEYYSKKVNFLLKRDRQATSQRHKEIYKNISELGQLWPWYAFQIPGPITYDDFSQAEFEPVAEIRCVVNSTIDFPDLAVPKLLNSKLRELFGLNLTVADVYNLLPWTWLSDWFTGLGNYISMFETIYRDHDIINVGFVTVLIDYNYDQVGTVRIYKHEEAVINSDGDDISRILSDPEDIPYRTGGRLKYRTRFSVDDLFGVKSVINKQGLLTDTQNKILGALSTKFT